MKKYRLDSIRQLKRLYAKSINDFLNGVITDTQAKTISYMYNGFLRVFEVSEIEKRIEALENLTNGAKNE